MATLAPQLPRWSEPVAWAAADRELNRARGNGAAHALILNLAVWCETPATADATAALVAGLGARYPVRLLLLAPAADKETCVLRVGNWTGPNASDLLRLEVPAGLRDEAHRLLAPLLVGDLPAVLWWQAPRPESGLALAQLTGRLLIDSLALGLGPAAVRSLASQIRPHAALADLAWGRLTPWRQLLCQGFESHPERQCVQDIAALTIAGGSSQAPGGLPALLAGWFTAQLGWKPQALAGSDGREISLQRPDAQPVRLRFEANRAPLAAVRLIGGDNCPTLTLEADHGRLRMELQRRGERVGQSVSMAAGLELRGIAQALAEELGMTSPDRLYGRALDAAGELLAQLPDAV